MKKEMFFWMSVLFLTIAGLSGCSSDDESNHISNNVVYESNPTTLNGTWHMVSANYGFGGTEKYQVGEISVTFNEATKTMSVENKKNINFLNNGNYPYEISTEKTASTLTSGLMWNIKLLSFITPMRCMVIGKSDTSIAFTTEC